MWSCRCFLLDETPKVKFQAAEINVRLATEECTTISQSMNRTNVRPKRRCFSCDNNRRLQTQPNVGHTEWDTHPKVILDHLNLSNRHPCPLYLASTVLSKKHTMSLVRCISSTDMELLLSFLSAGFMRIDPFIPKWTLKRKDFKNCILVNRSWRQKMMYFDVTGILKENGVNHQPHQQLQRTQEAYFYLFDHVRSMMFTQMFNVCVYASVNTIFVFQHYGWSKGKGEYFPSVLSVSPDQQHAIISSFKSKFDVVIWPLCLYHFSLYTHFYLM